MKSRTIEKYSVLNTAFEKFQGAMFISRMLRNGSQFFCYFSLKAGARLPFCDIINLAQNFRKIYSLFEQNTNFFRKLDWLDGLIFKFYSWWNNIRSLGKASLNKPPINGKISAPVLTPILGHIYEIRYCFISFFICISEDLF